MFFLNESRFDTWNSRLWEVLEGKRHFLYAASPNQEVPNASTYTLSLVVNSAEDFIRSGPEKLRFTRFNWTYYYQGKSFKENCTLW